MTPLVDAARKLLLVPCGNFYDDVLTVDIRAGSMSAQLSLNFFFQLCGYPFAPQKHEKLRCDNAFLGGFISFAHLSAGYVLLKVKESRRRKLLIELAAVL